MKRKTMRDISNESILSGADYRDADLREMGFVRHPSSVRMANGKMKDSYTREGDKGRLVVESRLRQFGTGDFREVPVLKYRADL